MLWDVFISHASEDKASVARPLAAALESAGLRVWIDEAQLKVGDSLRVKLDEGLSQSRFGVVILSRAFFSKPWPQRELGGLFSRPDAILPVWHELNASDVAAVSPLLADIIAASTKDGIEPVVEKILDVAATPLLKQRRNRPQYTSELSIRPERIRRALKVIESLGNPATWQQLAISAPGYPQTGWMGNDSSTLIGILYGFSAPLIEYRLLAYAVRRNLALLDARSRLQFALVESAFEIFTDEGVLATTAPVIGYTPRVPGWRTKRLANPARYWWQGVSPERFDSAFPFFVQSTRAELDADPLVAPQEFADRYRRAFQTRDEKVQQAIGLLGNGFYGFTPSSRPVLWRVCVALARIYQAVLGNSLYDPQTDDLASLSMVYEPQDTSCFPFNCTLSSEDTFEPCSQTLSATHHYLTENTLSRLRAYLAAPREHDSEI